uniref:Putative secreted protein n=1 Tax=Xenopsylla cheopis TaxID=163159 RepID=A0A6M2DW98_XENCH
MYKTARIILRRLFVFLILAKILTTNKYNLKFYNHLKVCYVTSYSIKIRNIFGNADIWGPNIIMQYFIFESGIQIIELVLH